MLTWLRRLLTRKPLRNDPVARAGELGPISSRSELVDALRQLLARELDGESLAMLEFDSVVFAVRLSQANPPLEVSEIVHHYLSDFDIRRRDPEFARTQLESFTTELSQMIAES